MPRAEYRQQEEQRVRKSDSLAGKFQTLNSLTVDLAFFSPDGAGKSSQVKYSVNLANAKSI